MTDNTAPTPPAARPAVAEEALREALDDYLEAQDALDNRELSGPNAEPRDALMRRRNRARDYLDAALAQPPEAPAAGEVARLAEIDLLIGNLVAATLAEEREECDDRERDAAADRWIRARDALKRAFDRLSVGRSVSMPSGWRVEKEPRGVLALLHTGTAQPWRFEEGEVPHALLSDILASMASTPVGEPAAPLRKQLQALGYSDTAINAMGDSTTMMQRAIDAAKLLRKAQNDRDEADWIDSLQPGERGRASPAPAASKADDIGHVGEALSQGRIPWPFDAASEGAEAVAMTREQIAEAGLGLEYVHSVLSWAASGYVHTPERIAQLHTAYSIVDMLVNAPPSEPEAQKAVAWKPTEAQILEAAEKAGLWPNTIHHWIGAFDRFFDALASPSPAASMEVQELTDAEIDKLDTFCLWVMAPLQKESVRKFAREHERALAAKNGWKLGEGRG